MTHRNRHRASLFAADRALARTVFWIFLALFTLVATGLPDHMDSEIEFQTTSALGRTASFALGGTSESDALVAARFAMPDEPRIALKVGEGGAYSWFGTGQALAAVPLYWAGRGIAELAPGVEARFAERTLEGVHRSEYYAHLLVGLRNPLLSALTCWLITLVALQLGLTYRWALVAGIGYGLTTFALAQARSTLSDVQATAALFGVLHLLLLMHARAAMDRPARPEHAALAGGLLGLAFLTRLVTAPAILVLVIGAFALLWKRSRKALVFFVVAAGAGVVAFLVFNWLRFGAPLESGYGDVVKADSFWRYSPLLGLAGLLLAPSKGLVFLAPLVVLAPLAFRMGEPGPRRFFLATTLGIVLAVFLPIVPTETWHGAWTFGPRYVLPALPFLWLAGILGAERLWTGPKGRVLVVTLLGLGFVSNASAVLVDHMTAQDLAVQAARVDWPDVPGGEATRFQKIQWEPRYAAPWVHWRIFRHRVAGLGEEFSSREIFFTEEDVPLHPNRELRPGFQHLAWIDHAALGGRSWPVFLFVLLCGVFAWRSALAASAA